MTKAEILRSLYGLINERGLTDTDDDTTTAFPINSEGEHCGWLDMTALLIEFTDSDKTFIVTIAE